MSKKNKIYKEHYDVTRLLNSKDADGNPPAFLIVCSKLRGPGKTFSISKFLFNDFIENGHKFILLTRNMGDLGNIADGIFEGYLQQEHPDTRMTEKIQMKGVFSKVFMEKGLGDEKEVTECGYVIPIRAADQIKKISSLFYDTETFYMDEFQPMNQSVYLKEEVSLLYNIYKSIARGKGSATRYMRIIMASNTINLDNPYFRALDLSSKIQSNTKFYRGKGVVFERCEVEGLQEQHDSQPIDKALEKHIKANLSNDWLNDDNSLVCKADKWGRAIYICTLLYNNEQLAVYEYPATGMTYVSRVVDKSCKYIYNLTVDSNLNIPLIRSATVLEQFRKKLFTGRVRCSDNGIQNILRECFL